MTKMNRRGFLRTIGIAAFAVAVVPALVTKRWNEESELQKHLEKMQCQVGFRGISYSEAGYVYAPYIPLMITDKITMVATPRADSAKYFMVTEPIDPELKKVIEASADEELQKAIEEIKREEQKRAWFRKLKEMFV